MESKNKYLANAGVLYIKIHNLHWNVVGKDFKGVHEYLESLYNHFADVIDDVAELIKMNGGQPMASLKDYLDNASIEEIASQQITSLEAIKILAADIEIMKAQAKEIRQLAVDADCFMTIAMMEDHLANYQKTLWFLGAMMK